MQKRLLLACALCLACLTAQAQNKKAIDSLMSVYNTTKHDTTKVLALTIIAQEYINTKPDTCISIAEKAIAMSEKIGFEKGKAGAWNNMGMVNGNKGKYPEALILFQKALLVFEKIQAKKSIASSLYYIGFLYAIQDNYPLALEYYQKSMKIREEIGDKKGIATSLNNIGLIYQYQGNYPLALEYYQKSMKIEEEIGGKEVFAQSLNDIGVIYIYQGNYPLALEYYQKSLKIREEIGKEQAIAQSLHNIGLIYKKQGNYSLALEYYQKSMEIEEEIGDKEVFAQSLNNMGIIYTDQGNYPLALEYYQKSLKIAEEIGDKNTLTYPLNGMATIYQKQKEYDKSIEYAQRSLEVAQEIKAPLEISTASQTLYISYKLKGDYAKALEYHEFYKQINDSLFNADKSKAIANLEARAEIERKDKEIEIAKKNEALFKKDAEIQRIEVERQRNANAILQKEQEADRLRNEALHEKDKRKQDSLQNLAHTTQLEANNLKLKQNQFNAEKKAREVELLKEKEAKEFQTYINYLVLAGLLSVLVFAFFIYHSRQKEKKAKEDVLQKNEEIQIQSEEILAQRDKLAETSTQLEELLEETRTQRDILEQQKQALQVLQQNRDLMVSAVSHDLRNPLNPILNYSSPHYAQKSPTEVLPIIHERAKAMQAMISDIMDIYKAEKLTVQAHPASLHQAGKQAIEVISEAQPRMPLIVNEIPETLQASFEYRYIERVLENLLSNAIKYTKPKEQGGQVRLFVESPLTPEGGNSLTPTLSKGEGDIPPSGVRGLRVCVQDNGMGIPQDKLEEIFLPFSNPNAKNIGGAKSVGIGLTFCKTIVEAHGSRIEVQSEVGKGSTFSFLLPFVSLSSPTGKVENETNEKIETLELILNEEEKSLLLPLVAELKTYKMQNARVRQLLQKMDTQALPALIAWQKAMLQARENNDVESFEKYLYLAGA